MMSSQSREPLAVLIVEDDEVSREALAAAVGIRGAKAEMAASLAARGLTLLDQLDALRFDYGLFASKQKSLTLPGSEGRATIGAAMERLRATSIAELAGVPVTSVQDLKEHDLLIYDLADGGRVSARPSGTEPKIKFYLEVVERPSDSMEIAEERAAARLATAEREILAAAGL